MGLDRAAGRRVCVRDARGALVFTRLWDDGGDVLEFESGHGYVCRADLVPNGWVIADGWPLTRHDQELAARAMPILVAT